MKTILAAVLWVAGSSLLYLPAANAADVDQTFVAAAAYRAGESREALRAIEGLVSEATTDTALQKQVEAGLMKLISGETPFEVKRFACKQLAVIGTEASLPAIAALLEDERTAGIACLALSTQPARQAGELLRQALASTTGTTRLQVLNTLANRKDTAAVPAIITLTDNQDPALAEAAIAALGRIASGEAREKLLTLRRDEAPVPRPIVLEASLQAAGELIQADEKKAAATIYSALAEREMPATIRRAALAGLFRTDRDGGEQRILVVLRSPEPDLKPTAIAAIPGLKAARVSARFAKEMPRLEPAEQALMVQALAARADEAAREAVVESLTAGEPVVRRAAIVAVAGMNDPATVPALVRLLTSGAAEEKQLAEQALMGLGGGAATDVALLNALKAAGEAARPALISVIGRRGDPQAFAILLEETADPVTAGAAFQAIGRIAPSHEVGSVLKALVGLKVADAREAAETAAAQTLSRMAEAAERSAALGKAWENADSAAARASVVGLLPVAGDAPAFAALESALKSDDAQVREAALRALADWPNAMAWDALRHRYRQPENESQRVVALRALVRLAGELNASPGADLMGKYRQLLEGAKNDNDRKLILGALGGAAHPEALPLALPLLNEPGVRAEAELAVKTIAEAIKAQHPQAAQDALQALQK